MSQKCDFCLKCLQKTLHISIMKEYIFKRLASKFFLLAAYLKLSRGLYELSAIIEIFV